MLCAGTRDVTYHRTIPPLLAALLESYRDWGGTASPPTIAIVDWRDVPTWSEFELLRDAFVEAGVPTVVCDPRDLTFEGGVLRAEGRSIDLVYRRVLINDILARPDDCAAWSPPTSGARSAWPTPSAASCRTRRRSSPC